MTAVISFAMTYDHDLLDFIRLSKGVKELGVVQMRRAVAMALYRWYIDVLRGVLMGC